ncbi:MAG: hypothetical protein RMK18_06730 [Armatimonadota bacterium]|nr:hypothetical protein [Armatimonadota bacterium]MCX7777449.1 hypothetical protein [Armatimonadota bacterium]MDW8025543.1 hypothetical protein [Armatimonadota bacterium]
MRITSGGLFVLFITRCDDLDNVHIMSDKADSFCVLMRKQLKANVTQQFGRAKCLTETKERKSF